MKLGLRRSFYLMFALLGSPTIAADVPGSADHPQVGRFEGSEIVRYKQVDFDEFVLLDRKYNSPADWGEAGKKDFGQVLEGRITRIRYLAPKEHSTLEVVRGYQDALAANGFEMLFECSNDACGGLRFKRAVVENSGAFVWADHDDQRYLAARKADPQQGDLHAAIYVTRNNSGGPDKGKIMTAVHVVQAKPRESKVVVVEADEMAQAIGADGKVALYGIYFDTDKASIKATSKPTLEQIAKLLKQNPALKLLVVGHTDSQGGFDYNLDLSKRRAAAVTQALIQDYGIAASRLKPWGVGYVAPAASNKSEQGRAKNRRVELVEQ